MESNNVRTSYVYVDTKMEKGLPYIHIDNTFYMNLCEGRKKGGGERYDREERITSR